MEQKQGLPMHAEPDLLRGRYANNLRTSVTQEEFILDFSLISPLSGEVLVARVI